MPLSRSVAMTASDFSSTKLRIKGRREVGNVGILERGFFFSISERASHQRFVPRATLHESTSHGTEKKALTMPIDKYAEIAGKIWLLICSGWRYLHGAVDSIK